MSNRLDQEREKDLEPGRKRFAMLSVEALGFGVVYHSDKKMQFMHNGEIVTHFFYTGWHTGKSITDGRGIKKLLKQLRA